MCTTEGEKLCEMVHVAGQGEKLGMGKVYGGGQNGEDNNR